MRAYLITVRVKLRSEGISDNSESKTKSEGIFDNSENKTKA